MAKLDGVKTVDMLNGEITKVAYEGAEYAKVDNGQAGDIGLVVNGWGNQKAGEFFEVKRVYIGYKGRTYTEVDGNTCKDANCYVEDMKYFRKISDISPTIEERVTAIEQAQASLESDVAALKSVEVSAESYEVKEGDVVTINFAEWCDHGTRLGLTEGKRYKVVKLSDGLIIIDDDGDKRDLFVNHPEVVNVVKSKANETIEFEGAEYRKVDREAREGDVVVLTGNDLPRWFTQGKAYKIGKGPYIEKSDSGHKNYDVYDADYGRTRETVDVYAPIAKSEPIEQAKYVPQKGDYITVTGNRQIGVCRPHFAKVGEVLKVQYRTGGNDRVITDKGAIMDELYRKATPAEVEQYEKALHKASFTVGDYVKVVKSYRNLEGNIAKITQIGKFRGDYGVADFEIEHLTGEYAGKTLVADADQLVKATDAEIAKATAPKLKAGDFVKFKESRFGITAGKVYEVVTYEDGDLVVVDDEGLHDSGINSGKEYEIVDAETAKWAKIGRKVGELRKGDIVRITNACGAPLNNGGLIEVISDSTEDSAHVKGDWAVCSKLVSPVESLFTTQN